MSDLSPPPIPNLLEAKLGIDTANLRTASFGDTRTLSDELNALILKGKKTASSGALDAYEEEGELPRIGEQFLVIDYNEEPLCVIEITSVEQKRFLEVDASFAAKEGEGDLSLAYWRAAHQEFFERNNCFSEDMMLVCEEFKLVQVL
jgi:uncharacterized protein YhfF